MKMHLTRITAALLTLILLLTPLSTAAAAALGDVSGDGKINTTDARLILQAAAGTITLNDNALAVADTNKDGKVNTTDARRILQFAAGIITDFDQTESPVTPPASNNSQAVFALINQYRVQNGLPELVYRSDVQAAVDLRAQETGTLFSHTRPSGKQWYTVFEDLNISYAIAGENIAYGYTTPEEVMDAWMNSDGHRANILNTSYTGVAIGIYEKDGVPYWVQLFIA